MQRDDWGASKFPFIPGHEVVGEVVAVGPHVNGLSPGDRVGVGWIANSCRCCANCLRGEENICAKGYTGLIVGGERGTRCSAACGAATRAGHGASRAFHLCAVV